MRKTWDQIEQVGGFAGVRRLVESEIRPALEALPVEEIAKGGAPKIVSSVMGWASGLFVLLFFPAFLFLPDTWWGVGLRFILFPLFFFGSFAGVIWLRRRTLADFIRRAAMRARVRAQVLERLAAHLGLTYVAKPGRRPLWLDWASRQSRLPQDIRDDMTLIYGSGEMEAATARVRDAGFLTTNVYVVGSEEQKRQYHEQIASSQQFEDGFRGARNGVPFEMLEWVEKVDEAPDIHHLMVLMTAPRNLEGVVQLRSKSARWWDKRVSDRPFQKVLVGPPAFRNAFDVRTSDQVHAHVLFDPAAIEAMIAFTRLDKFRASAIGDQLVFEIAGENRFVLVDEASGAWSEDTLRAGIADLAEALALVDALAAAFRVRPAG